MSQKVLTGRKVFMIVASFFGVIIAVNVTMAYMAIKTFPGLETRNSYVTSQNFDADKSAQILLGWDVAATVSDNLLTLSFRDSDDVAVKVAVLESVLGRATNVNSDQNPAFTFDGENYVAPVDLAPGNWNLRVQAEAQDGTPFRQRIVITVR